MPNSEYIAVNSQPAVSSGSTDGVIESPSQSESSSTSDMRSRQSVSVDSSDSGSVLCRGVPLDIAKDKTESPAQPLIEYPARSYGTSGTRAFQLSWYSLFPWLEYSVERDAVFCFPRRFFGSGPDKALTCTGFRDWKHAKGKYGTLTYHDQKCIKHKEAMLSYRLVVAQGTSVEAQLDRQGKKTRTIVGT